MPNPTANKIRYGLKNVYYAVATIDSDGAATYGTPVKISGAVNLSLEAQGERSVFHADDIDYYTAVANDGYEGDLEIALVPASFEKDILGAEESDESVLIESKDAEPGHFALLFEFRGDQHKVRHVMYNCTATRPTVEGETKAEGIEPKTETLSIKAGSIYNAALDKDIVKAKTKEDTDTETYNAWFSEVYQPTESQNTPSTESQSTP